MGADRFEAREGWVPANTEGSVWCYRTRGNAGVLAFRRSEDGQCLYEATHQDCYASDETITTSRRLEAVHFAATGATPQPTPSIAAPPAADSEPPPATPPRPTLAHDAALRTAWDRYIHATSEFLEHIKAHLDQAAHGELLGTVDQALVLVRQGAHTGEGHDAWSGTLGAVLAKAHALVSVREAADVDEGAVDGR
jgi:hypothetical protein